jgi:FtsH-binding integral membrane protein
MYLKPGQSLTQNARNNFVVKVYSIVSIQLLITTTFVALNIISEAFATIQANYMSLFWLSIVMIFVSMIVLCNFAINLVLSESQSKVFPNNLVWLTLFTVG